MQDHTRMYKPALSYKIASGAPAPISITGAALTGDPLGIDEEEIKEDSVSSSEDLSKPTLRAKTEAEQGEEIIVEEAASPARVDGSSMGIEPSDLTLDVLTVLHELHY